MTALDTSGFVTVGDAIATPNNCGSLFWQDLSPFAQGYVEALLGDLSSRLLQPGEDGPCGVEFGFSDLAPEALAMILRDCGAAADGAETSDWPDTETGRDFHFRRQGGQFRRFPPLWVYLNDAGKVMVEEAT